MQIELTRRAVTRWGADGTLTLEGRPFCDTVEHPGRLLPKGTYPVRRIRRCLARGEPVTLTVR